MMATVRSVTFHDDGSVVFEFNQPDDERANGMMQARFLMVPPTSAMMADKLMEAYDVAEQVLEFCLGEFDSSSSPDEDEGPGYDNPTERDEVRDAVADWDDDARDD